MSTPRDRSPQQRLDELLVDRTLGLLTPEGERELHRLARTLEVQDDDSYELVAAMISLATTEVEEMPPSLRSKLETEARSFVKNTNDD